MSLNCIPALSSATALPFQMRAHLHFSFWGAGNTFTFITAVLFTYTYLGRLTARPNVLTDVRHLYDLSATSFNPYSCLVWEW